jgi:hypothetical protein
VIYKREEPTVISWRPFKGTTMGNRIIPTGSSPRKLHASIERWRDNLIDLETLVDDKRQAVDREIDGLRVAVRERDRAARHLASLVEWFGRSDRPDVVGLEIADPAPALREASLS